MKWIRARQSGWAAEMVRDQRARVVAIAGVVMMACSSAPSAPSPAATIRIGHVTFINADSRPHTIVSDPVDLHTQCPALNRVGVIAPGESRESGTLADRTTCGFHDHSAPADGALQGRIVVD